MPAICPSINSLGNLADREGLREEDVASLKRSAFAWYSPAAHENTPPPSCCHSLVAYMDRYLLLFGGGASDFLLNDVQCYDTETNTWSYVEALGRQLVERRIGHSAVIHGNRMLVYGGQNDGPELLSDLLELDLDTCQWKSMTFQPGDDNGAVPGPRRMHSSVMYKNRMYVLMGEPCTMENAFCSLDLETYRWTTIRPNRASRDAGAAGGEESSLAERHANGRAPASGTAPSFESHLRSFRWFVREVSVERSLRRNAQRRRQGNYERNDGGGSASPVTASPISSITSVNVGSESEEDIYETYGGPPRPLVGHSAQVDGDYMYVFGGHYHVTSDSESTSPDRSSWLSSSTSTRTYSSSLFRYHFPTNTWIEMCVDSPTRPSPRYSSVMAIRHGILFVHGGDALDDGPYYGDLWVTDVRDGANGIWVNITDESGAGRPRPCSGHAGAVVKDTLYVFGGEMMANGNISYAGRLYCLPIGLPLSFSLADLACRWLARSCSINPADGCVALRTSTKQRRTDSTKAGPVDDALISMTHLPQVPKLLLSSYMPDGREEEGAKKNKRTPSSQSRS